LTLQTANAGEAAKNSGGEAKSGGEVTPGGAATPGGKATPGATPLTASETD
jgi:hypothetical protein